MRNLLKTLKFKTPEKNSQSWIKKDSVWGFFLNGRDAQEYNAWVLGSIIFFLFFFFRYKAIVRPMEIQASHALMKICVRAAIIWIVSMLLAIPEAVFSDLHPFHDKGTNKTFVSCAPYPHSDGLHPKIHSMASFLIFYVIPLSVISVYYYFIAKNLIRSAYNIPVEGNVHVRKQVETWLSTKIRIPCESGSKECAYREIHPGADCTCCAGFSRLGGLKEFKWLTQATAHH